MFRKIRSNRAPEKTVWADLIDELEPYIKKIHHSSFLVLSRFPRTIFVCMVILLIYSALWSFSSDLKSEHRVRPGVNIKSDSVRNLRESNSGLNNISRTAGDLRRTIIIRDKVDSVLNKKKLSRADSVFLEDALLELKLIQQP